MLLCSLLSPFLVCLGCYVVTLLPWFWISHYDIIVDVVIIIMLTISDEGWKVRLSRLDALFHSSHLGSEFRVLCLLTSVPNRVCVWLALQQILKQVGPVRTVFLVGPR